MNIYNTMQTDALDVLFTDRNKSYGAYQLRKNYNKRLLISVLVMMSVCLLSSAIFKWNVLHQSVSVPVFVTDSISLVNAQSKDQPPVQLPPIKQKPMVHVQVASVKLSTPKLTNDPVETPPPTQDAATNMKIDVVATDGTIDNRVAPPMEQSIGSGEGLLNKEPDYTKQFFTVEKQAQFPGGLDGWMKYLQHNLRSETPADNGAPAGRYTVIISFLVDREGNISDVKTDNDPGYGTAAEAMRVIQRGPKWFPAEQNGNAVIFRQIQSVVFVIDEP